MSATDEKARGFVYILEVKDIDLPVCKIGMTSRNPYQRCDEINNSSTGDFIWAVAHYMAVSECQKLESLVHSKLAPLRQKRREFFNINADDANTALVSIFDNQTEIKKINSDELVSVQEKSASKSKSTKKQDSFKHIDTEYAELLQLFSSVLNVKGKPFGQLSKPSFGMSDGNEGVQWNISVSTDTGAIKLGVNLEGMKYKGWPISTFIQSEMNNPQIEAVRSKLNNPESVVIRFARDAWQVTSRPTIVENSLGGKERSFTETSVDQWGEVLTEALGCLSREANYRGRAKQSVTLERKPKKGTQVRLMNVSPHLRIWSPLGLEGDLQENIKNKIEELQPVYDWVKKASHT
ncbi:MAG: hypothetical protein ACJAYG_000078 [Oceanicoccus sp.]|jgi:hypothetical protein